MNFPFFIARHIASSGQQSFSRFIIRIAIVAIAISVSVMIISTALITGFKKEVGNKIFGFWGHIHITHVNVNQSLLETLPVKRDQPFYPHLDTVGRTQYLEYSNWFGQEVATPRMTKGGIRHIQTFALKVGIVKSKSELEAIILKGVDQDYDWTFLQEYMQEGEFIQFSDSTMSRDIMISRQTANRLNVTLGDRFEVYFLTPSGAQLQRRFTVVGIYKTGLEEYDRVFALVDIRQVQRLLQWKEDEVSGFEVVLEDLDDIEAMDVHIYNNILPANLTSESIRRKFREIFEWLDLQDVNEVVILGLMIIVAIINMMTALLILILDRTNMIGTLKAMGSSNWMIQQVFLYYAAYIIVIGLFWGNLIGIGLSVLQDKFGFIQLSEENYYLSVAPIELEFWPIFLLNLGTLLVTVFFLVLPSYLVTSISPVKAIRFK